MKTTVKIRLATYNCNIVLIITDTLAVEAAKIYKKHKLIDESSPGEAEGILITPDIDKSYLIIDLGYLSHNTIAHEIYHAVKRVTEDRDIKDEEAQAWLAGHLSGEIYKYLDKKKITIKHG